MIIHDIMAFHSCVRRVNLGAGNKAEWSHNDLFRLTFSKLLPKKEFLMEIQKMFIELFY